MTKAVLRPAEASIEGSCPTLACVVLQVQNLSSLWMWLSHVLPDFSIRKTATNISKRGRITKTSAEDDLITRYRLDGRLPAEPREADTAHFVTCSKEFKT